MTIDLSRTGAVSDADAERQIQAVCDAGKSETQPVRADSPKRIFLQDAGDGEDYQPDYSEGVTWCVDKIGNDDTEYVRADIHDALEKETVRLKSGLLDAISTIKAWHNVWQMGQDSGITWQIYHDNAPEMKRLTALLSPKLPQTGRGNE